MPTDESQDLAPLFMDTGRVQSEKDMVTNCVPAPELSTKAMRT